MGFFRFAGLLHQLITKKKLKKIYFFNENEFLRELVEERSEKINLLWSSFTLWSQFYFFV